ncbi:hypothetical protein [Spiroplasma ixodetis]|uniref:hypothetical protein n=1 Tax=Spiroplasma ixodetis TaxID=2141 RepID=UPI002577D686|nr:hypothetical protein [Spiroplasma ixodetis]
MNSFNFIVSSTSTCGEKSDIKNIISVIHVINIGIINKISHHIIFLLFSFFKSFNIDWTKCTIFRNV